MQKIAFVVKVAQFDFKYKGVSEKSLSSAAAANVKNEQ